MAARETAVFGIYSDRLSTEIAIEALRASGFRTTDISALFPDPIHTKDFAPRKQAKVPQVAAFAVTGAIVSGLLSWLANSGAFPVLGLGTFASGSPLFMTLAGLGAGGALGGLIVALAGSRVCDFGERYEGRVRRGDILVSVHCDDSQRAGRATEILRATRAEDISSVSTVTTDYLKPNRRINFPAGERAVPSPLRIVTSRGAER